MSTMTVIIKDHFIRMSEAIDFDVTDILGLATSDHVS